MENLSITLGNFEFKNANLQVNKGDFYILLGPTGSGKTVLLEAIAGLKPISTGKIIINNTDMTNVKPESRNISLCYQDSALFPHMNVEKNIRYGLKFKNDKNNPKYNENFNSLVKFLKIDHILKRYPTFLSGGEKQRVSLARALIVNPDILLLDEPLSALDPSIKEDIQLELKNIHTKLKTTIIMVTHNFSEAYTLGNKISIIHKGNIIQTGTSKEIFQHPNSKFTAKFTGMKNMYDLKNSEDAYIFNINKDTLIGIRPENIIIGNEKLNTSFCFKGKISEIQSLGIYAEINIKFKNLIFISYLSINRILELNIKKEDEVYFGFDEKHVTEISHS